MPLASVIGTAAPRADRHMCARAEGKQNGPKEREDRLAQRTKLAKPVTEDS